MRHNTDHDHIYDGGWWHHIADTDDGQVYLRFCTHTYEDGRGCSAYQEVVLGHSEKAESLDELLSRKLAEEGDKHHHRPMPGDE